MQVNSAERSDPRLDRLEQAIRRARFALGWERAWPRLVPIVSLLGLYVLLSWFGFWRLGGDWLRLGTLAVLALMLLAAAVRLAWVRWPRRSEGVRRVELHSGLPHRPALGISDRISRVADDSAAQALWAANQARLLASLKDLKAGTPRPAMAERDPNGLRFAVPVLLALAFAVSWGEWMTRLGEAWTPLAAQPVVIAARVDAWIDPPPYTGQAPVFLSRGTGQAPSGPVTVPEGSKLTVRVVSNDVVAVTIDTGDASATLQSKEENRAADTGEAIRSYEAVLDGNATVAIASPDGTASYPVTVTEDHPPTVGRGPLEVNRAGTFTLGFDVADDYGVTEGVVTFRPGGAQPEGARPLVEPPTLPLRIDRAQARKGVAVADGRLEAHPYAGVEVAADAVVKDAAAQEGRPADPGIMTLPARPFYQPLARALIEQRRILALDANQRDIVATALDALAIAPERIPDSATYLGLRVGYHRMLAARNDDDLREMLDYLWEMARAIEDGDVSDAEERLNAARQALEQALKDGASQEEIARLMDELRQAMQDFLQSYAAEMAERGMQNMPMPNDPNMQTLSEQDIQEMLDRIEDLAQLGDAQAAQQLLSELQQMLDNLQMAQPGQMQPGDQQMMQQMDELANIMREQQRLMDDTFQLNQGRRPGQRQPGQQGEPGEEGGQSGEQELSEEELQQLMEQLEGAQGELAEQLRKLLEQMQEGAGQRGEQGEQGEGGQDGQQGQQGEGGQGSQPSEGQGQAGRSLGRAGRSMGDASRSLGSQETGEAYGHQGDALDALREGMQGMMQQMFANQPGQPGQQPGQGRPNGQRDPLGRPQRTEGPDLGQNVKVPDEIDVERARQILEAIRNRLGERNRPRPELDYLERLLGVE